MLQNIPFVLSMVVAATDKHLAIGRQNQLLWHLSEDLKYFKNLTWGKPVIMGRKTFESIGKPLPGRQNIVLTGSRPDVPPDVLLAETVEQALQQANEAQTSEVFVIGGGQVYEVFMPLAQRIYLTRVFVEITDADTFFPAIETEEWTLKHAHLVKANERQAWDLNFEVWDRNT